MINKYSTFIENNKEANVFTQEEILDIKDMCLELIDEWNLIKLPDNGTSLGQYGMAIQFSFFSDGSLLTKRSKYPDEDDPYIEYWEYKLKNKIIDRIEIILFIDHLTNNFLFEDIKKIDNEFRNINERLSSMGYKSRYNSRGRLLIMEIKK